MSSPSPHSKHKSLRRIEGHNHARALNFACFKNQPFLRSSRAKQWLLDAIDRARTTHGFHLWAYCVMPDHAHLLIYYPAEQSLRVSSILSTIKRSVTLRAIGWASENSPASLHRMEDRQPNGKIHLRFWQRGGGYDRNLHTPRHLWSMIDYIHHNPVEAGLCDKPEDWEYSSARALIRQEDHGLRLDRELMPSDPR